MCKPERLATNLKVLCFLVVALSIDGTLASPGDLDTSFESGSIVSPPGNTKLLPQPDGKVIVAGGFTSIAGSPRNRIARLNNNGSVDGTFLNGLAGADNTVYCVDLQSNGQVLIGGAFTSVNGTGRNRLARLNTNGSIDTGFLNGMAGADDWVQAIKVLPDGKILIGGYFTLVNGTSRGLIARLNSDGSVDSSFQNGMLGVNDSIFTFGLQSDGKILIGGAFTLVNGMARNYIARLHGDGSVDEDFMIGVEGANGAVNSLAIQGDGKILVVGSFTLMNGVSRNRIARLNTDGSLDTGYLNAQPGADQHVYSVVLQSDGKAIIGGSFTSINGLFRNRIARLHINGAVDDWFGHRRAGANEFVGSLAIEGTDKLLMCGDFTSVNGVVRNQFARLLTGYGPPQMEDERMQGGVFSCILSGTPGQTFIVQASRNLKTWVPVRTNFLGNSPPTFTDVDAGLFSWRFYRMVKQ